MKIYQNRRFAQFARQQRIRDQDLCEAIERAERGLIDAELGGHVIKQRIARPNEGRSGGFRTLILFRAAERAFFVYGFAKNQRENITDDELKALKNLARQVLDYTLEQMTAALDAEEFSEVNCDEKDLQE